MCGIAGWAGFSAESMARDVVGSMVEALHHRGPDSSGLWNSEGTGAVLGHARLSIHDLSIDGAQPMVSADGRYTIVFNGEIYNFEALRKELSNDGFGQGWRSQSDTEVLLELISSYGVEVALTRCEGMFAFAVFDKISRKLILARDRFGEKPLYFSLIEDRGTRSLIFSSELKSLFKSGLVDPELDDNAVELYKRYNYVPEGHCIYKSVNKVSPGEYLEFDLSNSSLGSFVYWDTVEQAVQNSCQKYEKNFSQSVAELDDLLIDVIQRQLVSDVPIGTFLSGGIDSTVVTAIASKVLGRDLNSFSLGFDDSRYDESCFANEVASFLGSRQFQLKLNKQDILDIVSGMSDVYCEPFSDSSQIPTIGLSKFTRENVVVALSGDGGDEVFGGYNRHSWAHRLNKMLLVPGGVRKFLFSPLSQLNDSQWEKIIGTISSVGLAGKLPSHPISKIHKLLEVLSCKDMLESYNSLTFAGGSNVNEETCNTFVSSFFNSIIRSAKAKGIKLTACEIYMLLDTLSYLPGDILTKVDRASMNASLEVRTPFLNHEIFNFAWRLPLEFKNSGKGSKRVLRELLNKYIPSNLIDRPKTGFGAPLGDWLRCELREWAETLLANTDYYRIGNYDPDAVKHMWEEHIDGNRDWSSRLWNFLMFAEWCQSNMEQKNG